MLGGVLFHRTVDTHKPSLPFVYYMSALLDKCGRLMSELGKAPEYIDDVHSL